MPIINRRGATDLPASAHDRRHRRTRHVGPLLGAPLAAALIEGCGGSSTGGSATHVGSSSSGGSVAHISSTTTTNSSIKPSTTSNAATKPKTKPSALAFAVCMRAHGVPNFPDPNPQGQIPSGGITTTASGGINPSSPAYQTASNDCKSLSTATKLSQAQSGQVMASQLKFAVCMRANGVPNFPDPTSNGEIGNNGAISGVNPSSPAVQNAEKNCSKFLSPPPLPGGGPSAPPAVG